MTNLKAATDDELRAELAKREKAAKAYRPIPLAQPDLAALIECTEAHVKEIAEGDSEDSDASHYIYEEAMKAVYGPNVFDWINAQ